jgi:recombination protein RecT
MGDIAKAQQGIQQNKPSTFADLVHKVSPQFQSVMPKGFKAERLAQMAISAYNQTPKLAECSMPSILSCCLRCASLGLEPSAVDGLGRAYILPYFNRRTGATEAQFILGKNGMVELVRRSGEVNTLRTQCVYDGDEFDYWEDEGGVHFSYRPNLDADHGKEHLRLAYVSASLKDGGLVFLAMSKKEIDQVKGRSKAANSGPWVTDYEAMAEKTVLRRAFNRGMLPRSVELSQAVSSDEAPVALDEDGYQVFGQMPDAVEAEDVKEAAE